MASPLLVSVAIFDRGDWSRNKWRKIYEYEAYHWALLIGPESLGTRFWSFDVTDAPVIDETTFRMTNPAMEWYYRGRNDVSPEKSSKILGRVVINELPNGTTYETLNGLLATVPMPLRNSEPQQSCVTWVVNALELLQENKVVEIKDMKDFKDKVMALGDEQIELEKREVLPTTYYNAKK